VSACDTCAHLVRGDRIDWCEAQQPGGPRCDFSVQPPSLWKPRENSSLASGRESSYGGGADHDEDDNQ
jgi:hypothetical protein